MGVHYFECPAGTGVFAQAAQLAGRAAPSAPPPQVAAPVAVAAADAAEEIEYLPSKQKTADGSTSLGQQITWKGNKATVKYIGEVKFSKGEWLGLELAEGKGVHDGCVMGVPYFLCQAGKGVFAQAAQLSVSAAVPSRTFVAPIAVAGAAAKLRARPHFHPRRIRPTAPFRLDSPSHGSGRRPRCATSAR
mmetsp:Transcript_175697/g.563454  ORF Transcript_175697/g.563454 Transcript_175697/m.563454 type:complete len:190 (+) Transcript_175697:302-871(+)